MVDRLQSPPEPPGAGCVHAQEVMRPETVRKPMQPETVQPGVRETKKQTAVKRLRAVRVTYVIRL